MLIKESLKKLVEGRSLTEEESERVFEEVTEGIASEAQIAALLTSLRMKGESVEEITGAAKTLRRKCIKIEAPDNAIDTCGTGGDGKHTINISTLTAFVVAAAGIPVAKHGNYAMSSACGSADLLETLGINIKLSPSQLGDCLKECNFGFLFAPALHPAMKYAVKPRKDINFRTIFNIIGPLCNPAGVKYQLLGVFSPDLTEKIAKVLAKLGVKRAWVVHSQDGMDEISPFAPTKVSSVEESGEVATFYIHPEELGFKGGNCEELRGGSKEENVAIANSIIEGRDKSSRYSAVLINAAAAFYIAGKVKDLKEGVNLAETLINTGEVKKLLDKIRSFH